MAKIINFEGKGKSAIAMNAAVILARKFNTLIIDASEQPGYEATYSSPRKPSHEKLFDYDDSKTLFAWVENYTDQENTKIRSFDGYVLKTNAQNLCLIAGKTDQGSLIRKLMVDTYSDGDCVFKASELMENKLIDRISEIAGIYDYTVINGQAENSSLSEKLYELADKNVFVLDDTKKSANYAFNALPEKINDIFLSSIKKNGAIMEKLKEVKINMNDKSSAPEYIKKLVESDNAYKSKYDKLTNLNIAINKNNGNIISPLHNALRAKGIGSNIYGIDFYRDLSDIEDGASRPAAIVNPNHGFCKDIERLINLILGESK